MLKNRLKLAIQRCRTGKYNEKQRPVPSQACVMNDLTVERQQLLEAVRDLPDEGLPELANFLGYLHYKTRQQKGTETNQPNFLTAIAGLGQSDHQDIAERDEEILQAETDPIRGWTTTN